MTTRPDDRLGYRTNPMRVGAPLPEEMQAIDLPQREDMLAELVRAQTELMYAIARHRQAWHSMRAYKKAQEERKRNTGFESFLDSDPKWKVKTGDVAWWRGEMNAQAATVTALSYMVGMGESLEGWVETTDYGDMAASRRTFIRGR